MEGWGEKKKDVNYILIAKFQRGKWRENGCKLDLIARIQRGKWRENGCKLDFNC
jgi:hypothetical protein